MGVDEQMADRGACARSVDEQMTDQGACVRGVDEQVTESLTDTVKC